MDHFISNEARTAAERHDAHADSERIKPLQNLNEQENGTEFIIKPRSKLFLNLERISDGESLSGEQRTTNQDATKESLNYPDGPIEVEHNLWLDKVRSAMIWNEMRFSVVINVAREISNMPSFQHEVTRHINLEFPENLEVVEGPTFYSLLNLPNAQGENLLVENIQYTLLKTRTGFFVHHYHVFWEHHSQLEADLDALTEFIKLKTQIENKRVLIHCQCGASRSAALALAFLISNSNISFNEAYDRLKSKSPYIGPNLSLIFQVNDWERKKRCKSGSNKTLISLFPSDNLTNQIDEVGFIKNNEERSVLFDNIDTGSYNSLASSKSSSSDRYESEELL